MNANWFRKLVSDEIREVVMWAGLADKYEGMKSKEVDKKGKTFYRLTTKIGDILIYSPKVIYVNGHKCHSVNETKRHIQYRYVN